MVSGKLSEVGRALFRGVQGLGAYAHDTGRIALRGTRYEARFEQVASRVYLKWRAAVETAGLKDGVAPYWRLKGFETVPLRQWLNWKWQVKNAFDTPAKLLDALGIKYNKNSLVVIGQAFEQAEIDTFPMRVPPAYAAMIDPTKIDPAVIQELENPANWHNPELWQRLGDPIFKQAFLHPAELIKDEHDDADPLHEDHMKPAGAALTHRYPDRVLFEITGQCGMYCRHCTRRRKVDQPIPMAEIEKGLDYIRQHSEIRDVLISGGDAFLASDELLEAIISKLEKIPHVEVIRFGTRTPVVLPQRITPALTAMLKRHQGVKKLWLNTHFNHPRELENPESRRALALLADAGLPMGNQSVLLKGVNDDPATMLELVRRLVANRVRPYYIYINDLSVGISHFRTPVSTGLQIMKAIRGWTSGFANPTFVIDAPGGGGKIPVAPQYVVGFSDDGKFILLRNFATFDQTGEKGLFKYPVSGPADIEAVRQLLRMQEGA